MKLVTLNNIEGGKGADSNINEFDIESLVKGAVVELEHTDDILIALEITVDHLSEDRKYYEKLEKIEKHEPNSAKEEKIRAAIMQLKNGKISPVIKKSEDVMGILDDETNRGKILHEPNDWLKPRAIKGPGD